MLLAACFAVIVMGRPHKVLVSAVSLIVTKTFPLVCLVLG